MTSQSKMDKEQTDLMRNPAKKPYQQPHLQHYGSVSMLTQSGATGSAEGSSSPTMGMAAGASDRSVKTAIVRIGDHPLGIGLYLFDYKAEYCDTWGHGRQFGVMADEVEQVMPNAVSLHPDGYRMVNYAMLGISRPLH